MGVGILIIKRNESEVGSNMLLVSEVLHSLSKMSMLKSKNQTLVASSLMLIHRSNKHVILTIIGSQVY